MAAPLPIKHWIRLKTIGEGSYGAVSVARNLEDGGLFAVKSATCKDEEFLECLEREIDILKKLDSPFVVRYLGQDRDGEGKVNLFMEYMEGGDLCSLSMRSKGLPEMAIKTYTAAILRGLEYLHEKGIIHCDVKGRNVLLGLSGEVKLADFGSAKMVSSELPAILAGTLRWMAPEILERREQGTASDIWSLGCTLVEMATGKVPKLPDKFAGISDSGLDFLDKCFMPEPSQRWTASQLLHHPFLASTSSNQILCSPRTVLSESSEFNFPGGLDQNSGILNPNQRIKTFSICQGLDEKQWTETSTTCSGFDENERNKILTSCSDFDEEQTIETLKSHRASEAKQRIKTLISCSGFDQEGWESKDWITVRSSMAGELRALPCP
ncbi:hypothetical protein AMTRI_Chr08g167030 [Amborella trichopoda]